jgi:hypothetical protein
MSTGHLGAAAISSEIQKNDDSDDESVDSFVRVWSCPGELCVVADEAPDETEVRLFRMACCY